MVETEMFLVRVTYTHNLLNVSVHCNDFVVPDIETALGMLNQGYTNKNGGMISIVDLEKTFSAQIVEITPQDTAAAEQMATVKKMYAHISSTTVYLDA